MLAGRFIVFGLFVVNARPPLPAAVVSRGNKGERDAEEFAALHDDRLFKFSGIAQNLSNIPVEPDAIEDRVVLDNVNKQIRECLEHAEECTQKSAELPNGSPFRQDFLQVEKRWLELARSIEFGEQLGSFTKKAPSRTCRVKCSGKCHFDRAGKAFTNERKYPFVVEAPVTANGLDVELNRQISGFHKSHRIPPRFGRTVFRDGQSYYRWCFSDLATARAFVEQFGGAFYKTTGT